MNINCRIFIRNIRESEGLREKRKTDTGRQTDSRKLRKRGMKDGDRQGEGNKKQSYH